MNLSDGQIVEYLCIDLLEIEKTMKTVEEYLKRSKFKVDILVNNAGIGIGDTIGKTDVPDYEKVLKTNLEGTYFMRQVFYNYMRRLKIEGNILNLLSTSGKRPATTAYNCSKWGERGLTIGMAKKFIRDGIVVNAIAPGPTVTGMLGIKPEKDGISMLKNPAGCYTMPEEIANIATVLVSDMGRMIVGDVIYVSGGAAVVTVDDISY